MSNLRKSISSATSATDRLIRLASLLLLVIGLPSRTPAVGADGAADAGLVRVTLVRTDGPTGGHAGDARGRALPNYRPSIVETFESAGVVVDESSHVATFLGFGWIDMQRGSVRVEVVAGDDERSRRLRAWLIGVDQSTGIAVVRPEAGTLPKSRFCVQCDIRNGTTVVAPVLEHPGRSQLETVRVVGLGGAAAVPAGAWELTISRRLSTAGAPLLDVRHRLLGFVATQEGAPGPSGQQAVLVPTSQLLTSAARIIKAQGDIRTGWLGVYLDGVRVRKVASGGPAERAGLQANDLVLGVNGTPLHDVRRLIRIVQDTPIGHPVHLALLRSGAFLTLAATVGQRRPEATRGTFLVKMPEGVAYRDPAQRDSAMAEPWKRSEFVRLGADLAALGREAAAFLGVPVQKGVLISSVEPRTPASEAGLRAGDVIVEIDGLRVDQPAAVETRVESLGPGETLAVRLLRSRREQVVRIRLGSRPREPERE